MRFALYSSVILAVGIPSGGVAQTMYESSEGESSVVLPVGGLALINFSDESIKIGVARIVSTSPIRFGIELKAEATDGFLSLVEDDATLPQGTGALFVTHWHRPERGKVTARWVTLDLAYTAASLRLVDTTATGGNAINKEAFHGVTAMIRVNALAQDLVLPGDILLGVAAGLGRHNNYEDLDEVEACDQVTPPTGATNRSVLKCSRGRLGAYTVATRFAAALDVIWFQGWTKNRMALSVFGRYTGDRHNKPFSTGAGVFFTEAGSPLKTVGGLTLEVVEDDARLGFQAGLPF